MNISSLIQIVVVERNILMTFLRTTMLFIESIFYGLLGGIFSVIFSITQLDQMEAIQNLYSEIETRMYVVIGIFMLFKITITLLTYLVNPEMINNKESGANKLVLRIMTSLVLLIAVPKIVFPILDKLQLPLVVTVSKVITGNVNDIAGSSGMIEMGQEAALSLMSTFFYVDQDCISGDVEGQMSAEEFKIDNIGEISSKAGLACNGDKKRYMYIYHMPLGLLVAGIAVVMLMIVGVNIATRAFKLIVLKLLAPIPILAYITTKSTKDSMLNSYVKLFASTYIDLFIQFGFLYLSLLLFSKIKSSLFTPIGAVRTAVDVFTNVSILAIPFLFIGLLIFAFQAPKFIKKALNIKDSEFGTGIAGMLTTGAMLVGTGGSAIAAAKESKKKGGTIMQNIGAGLAAGVRATATGARGGFSGSKADAKAAFEAIQKSNASRAELLALGGTLSGAREARLQRLFGGETQHDRDERKIKALEEQSSAAKQLKDYVMGEGKKKTAHILQSVAVNGSQYDISLDMLNEAISYANSANGDGKIHFNDGRSYAANSSVINNLLGDLEAGAGTLYAEAIDGKRQLTDSSGAAITDSGAFQKYREALASSLDVSVSALGNRGTDVKEMKKIEKSNATEVTYIKSTDEYMKNKANANFSKN